MFLFLLFFLNYYCFKFKYLNLYLDNQKKIINNIFPKFKNFKYGYYLNFYKQNNFIYNHGVFIKFPILKTNEILKSFSNFLFLIKYKKNKKQLCLVFSLQSINIFRNFFASQILKSLLKIAINFKIIFSVNDLINPQLYLDLETIIFNLFGLELYF